MKALTFSEFGSSKVLKYATIADPVLKENEILVEMKAIGLNFGDIYRRKGNYYLTGVPPFIAGYEVAGIVINSNNTSYTLGDRIAFADVPLANAELVAVPIEKVIPLTDEISFETAASVLLQGLTATYLATNSHKTIAGETVLVHAAAGGVGQLLIQISKLLGATVIGLTSTKEKAEFALSNGANNVFLYDEDWRKKVLTLCPQGVDVTYDSVGSTLSDSFEITKDCGQVVFFGMSGGDPDFINPRMLMDSSKTLTGCDLWSYLNSKEERISKANQLFDWINSGQIKISPATSFKLSKGRKAHDYLESRNSTGKIILIP